MGKIILVTGGARSGKSSFAECYAEKFGKKVAYIATAEIRDEEMKFRVKLHRERRPSYWKTYEAPQAAEVAIRTAGEEHDLLLFDCITLYLSNILCAENLWEEQERAYAVAEQKISALIDASRAIDGMTIFVTNEVGGGIVPADPLSRLYRDIAGFANQQIGRAADELYLVTCGMAIDLKKHGEAI